MYVFEQASDGDIPRLTHLLGLLFAQEADFTPEPARQRRALRLLLSRPEQGRVYCARRAGEAVGMVSVLFSLSTAEGGRVGWLEDLIVDPAHRRQGLGRGLLSHALVQARALGCSRLSLLTDADNDLARRLYTQAGFDTSTMVLLRRPLTPTDT